MAGLRESLKRMMALPDREAPEWLLAAKRSRRTLDFLFTELRDCRQTRRVAEPRVKTVLPAPVPLAAANAEMRKQIERFDRKQNHERARRVFAEYPELSYEDVARCIRLGYDADTMLQLRGASIAKLIREGRSR